MDSMIYNKMLHTPIYTGTPGEPPKSRPREKTNDNAFKELLEQRLKEESQVSFSTCHGACGGTGRGCFL